MISVSYQICHQVKVTYPEKYWEIYAVNEIYH